SLTSFDPRRSIRIEMQKQIESLSIIHGDSGVIFLQHVKVVEEWENINWFYKGRHLIQLKEILLETIERTNECEKKLFNVLEKSKSSIKNSINLTKSVLLTVSKQIKIKEQIRFAMRSLNLQKKCKSMSHVKEEHISLQEKWEQIAHACTEFSLKKKMLEYKSTADHSVKNIENIEDWTILLHAFNDGVIDIHTPFAAVTGYTRLLKEKSALRLLNDVSKEQLSFERQRTNRINNILTNVNALDKLTKCEKKESETEWFYRADTRNKSLDSFYSKTTAVIKNCKQTDKKIDCLYEQKVWQFMRLL
ncbi:hypothetical protein RFI_35806, partial [Reticulomyxa filosa]